MEVLLQTTLIKILTASNKWGLHSWFYLATLGTVQIATSSNNSATSGTVEFIKVKDSSGNVTTSGNCNISSAFSF